MGFRIPSIFPRIRIHLDELASERHFHFNLTKVHVTGEEEGFEKLVQSTMDGEAVKCHVLGGLGRGPRPCKASRFSFCFSLQEAYSVRGLVVNR